MPLFFALKGQTGLKSFLLGYCAGFVFWAVTIYWLINVTVPGAIILVLYLALYSGVFAFLISRFLYFSPPAFLLVAASLWSILEYIRSYLFTGFSWALLGYSQCFNLPVIQIADITGAWGVSFLVMMVNAAAYSLLAACRLPLVKSRNKNQNKCQSGLFAADSELQRTKQSYRSYFLVAVVLILTLSYGYYKLYNASTQSASFVPFKLTVVQGNIPQELKWDPDCSDFILNRYLRLTNQAAAASPDLIIWPEAASPAVLGEDKQIFERIFSLSKGIKAPLLIGAVTNEKGSYFNSAILISSGEISARYDKLHLVPFGEYIPLKGVFTFLEDIVPIGDIERGQEYTIFNGGEESEKFSVLICFEDLFPRISREFVRRGARFLVNITNDAWYKETPAAHQHFQASVFRAVENRVFLVRAANTGVSGFIGPEGRVISLVQDKNGRQIFNSGIATERLLLRESGLSFYTRLGDVFIVFCFALFSGIMFLARFHMHDNIGN